MRPYDPTTSSARTTFQFHTIIWPGMLIGYDGSLNLPYDVPSNEYLNVEARKLSKSRRWVIEMGDALDRMTPTRGAMPWPPACRKAQDVNFTWEEFVRRNNEEPVATWGNLANRVLGFAVQTLRRRGTGAGPIGRRRPRAPGPD